MKHRHLLPLLIACLLVLPGWAQQDYSYKMAGADKEKMERAVADYQKGRYRQSAEQLRVLSQRYPNNADIYFYLGLNAVKHDFNVAGIRRYFPKVIQLVPDYPNAVAHYYMGLIHYTDDHFDDAVADFNRYFERANANGTPESDALYMEASNYLYWSQFLADAYRNMVPFNPTVVRNLSSSDDEMLPFFTHDERYCFFLRNTTVKSRTAYYNHELSQKQMRLYMSQLADTAYTLPQMLPAPFNQGDPEGGVSLTSDNHELFYSVIRRVRGYNNSDIYCSRLTPQGWTPVHNLGDSVNNMDSWESQPSVTPDGQWLYFASNRKGGLGGTDIYRCHRKADGTWGEPVNLGSSVNTPGNEKCPFIHADGHTLYFASNGWQGFGGYDMYFINLDESGEIPTNMGLPINSEDDDISFGVTANGQHSYFAGRPPALSGLGGTDILWFELYPAARPEGMKMYSGRVTAPDGKPIQATLAVDHSSQHPALYRTDEEGRFSILVSLKHDNIVTVKALANPTGNDDTTQPKHDTPTFPKATIHPEKVLHIPASSRKSTPPPEVIILDIK